MRTAGVKLCQVAQPESPGKFVFVASAAPGDDAWLRMGKWSLPSVRPTYQLEKLRGILFLLFKPHAEALQNVANALCLSFCLRLPHV